VILHDTYEVVAGIWTYLIRVKESEIRALPVGFEDLRDVPNVPQEAKWLIGFWLGRGRSTPANKPSSWMKKGGERKGFWGERVKARIARQLRFIRHWKVRCKSYLDAPDVRATWFIDPPYQVAGKSYKESAKKIDFPSLGEWCSARRGQIMVCEQEGADWLPFRRMATGYGAQKATRKRYVKEVIWTKSDRKTGFGLEVHNA
jgi:hypothetical protein